MIPNITFSAVGKDGWEFFKKYDRDGDYKLSLDEYEAIYHTLVANGIRKSLSCSFLWWDGWIINATFRSRFVFIFLVRFCQLVLCVFVSLLVVICFFFVIAGGFFGDKIYKAYFLPGQMIPNMTFSAVGKDGWEFFKKYDRDGDLKLSLDEYEAIYHTLVANGINVSLNKLFLKIS
jgi:hypothetical protein